MIPIYMLETFLQGIMMTLETKNYFMPLVWRLFFLLFFLASGSWFT